MYLVVAMHVTLFVAASTTHRTMMTVSTPDVRISTITQSSARIHPTTPDLVRLNKPVLNLNVTAVNNQINRPWRIAALPTGEVAVVNGGVM